MLACGIGKGTRQGIGAATGLERLIYRWIFILF